MKPGTVGGRIAAGPRVRKMEDKVLYDTAASEPLCNNRVSEDDMMFQELYRDQMGRYFVVSYAMWEGGIHQITPIGPEETAGELFDRLAPMGADCLKKTVRALEEKRITPVKQDEQKATYAPMLDKTMAELDFTRPAAELHNLIRGLNPWPVAYTHYGDKKLKVFAARVEQGSGEPGTVLDADRFIIACGEGALRFTEVQLEGSRRMSAEEFLRGKKIFVGRSLTAN